MKVGLIIIKEVGKLHVVAVISATDIFFLHYDTKLFLYVRILLMYTHMHL